MIPTSLSTGAQAQTGDLVVYASGAPDAVADAMPVFPGFSRQAHDLELGVMTPLFSRCGELYAAALRQGLGSLDTAAVCRLIEERSGLARPPAARAPE